MCGIAGIFGPKASKEVLSSMLAKQTHRGPDFTGIFVKEAEVALGHNRLSILDLSDAANQPFHSPDGRYTLIFNGEIYNYLEIKRSLSSKYQFITQSDTEVLLFAFQEWGTACLHQLNGMFAFAIWDHQTQKLTAARDRFGVKPLHYSLMEGSLVLSSEITPIWTFGVRKKANKKIWSRFFVQGRYGEEEETFWEDVFQLPAGHWMTWQEGKLTVTPWYDFVNYISRQPEIPQDQQEEYILDLLRDAVKLRFRADVPVGFNLSGGLDSSTLLALVSDLFPQDGAIETFTFMTGDDRYDEILWVKQMLQGRPYPLNSCLLTCDEVPELTAKMSLLQSEPFGGIPTLAYSKVFQRAREKGFLVLLDGQGADEAWAGYDYYLKKESGIVQGTQTSPLKPNALVREFAEMSHRQAYPQPFKSKILNLQYRDIFKTKIPRALRFNDRVSMAHSTELREPFLDYRLVEYVFSRPESFKIRDGQQKWLLRKIAGRFLGDQIALAPKRPVQTPQREWLAGPLKDWVYSQLESLCNQTDWFEKDQILKEWEDYLRGNQDNSFYLWQWINTAELMK